MCAHHTPIKTHLHTCVASKCMLSVGGTRKRGAAATCVSSRFLSQPWPFLSLHPTVFRNTTECTLDVVQSLRCRQCMGVCSMYALDQLCSILVKQT